MERREVVVVGGGPAGAATAIRLARAGRDVLVFERAAAWRWRACGVFTSPATVDALARLDVPASELARVARPIAAMRVETAAVTSFRLTYGDGDALRRPAVGLDRSALDPLLLGMASTAGAEVRTGASVRTVVGGHVTLVDGMTVDAGVVVGADGLRSVVARDAGVVRRPALGGRAALSFHVDDPTDVGDGEARRRDARMVVFAGGYVGLAPVPGRRVNVGIVLAGADWLAQLRARGASHVAHAVMAAIPPAPDDDVAWRGPTLCDAIEGVAPVGARVSSRAGREWLVVGDAAGFLDPFTGEGLHRALRSAELAAPAVERHLGGDPNALAAYDRTLARRTRGKDAVSVLVQAFLAAPPAFEFAARRLAARPAVRETMSLVMGDLVPASRAFDPRFLAALLRP